MSLLSFHASFQLVKKFCHPVYSGWEWDGKVNLELASQLRYLLLSMEASGSKISTYPRKIGREEEGG
jgi:hypothetical protein